MHEALEKRQEELASPRVSFRDPGGAVVRDGSHIYRVVAPEAASTLRSFLATATAARWQSNGGFVTTFPVDNPHAGHAIAAPICQERGWDLHDVFVAEHGVIPFVSYPWEWAPCMLGAAADLTLRLADELLDEGYGLKDATPLNVLFRGPQPVLVDVLSVERRDPGAAHWLAHGQFVRTFLLPLALSWRLQMPLDKLLYNSWDGLDVEQVYKWLPLSQRLSQPFLTSVTLPVWLKNRAESKGESLYQPKPLSNPLQAAFVLRTLIQRCLRSVAKLQNGARAESRWSGYSGNLQHYPDAGFQEKEAFVRESLRDARPKQVLDIGCNDGHFSRMAAESGAEVVGIDSDPEVVGATWHSALKSGANILPLVVNIARPTAPSGWRGEECDSFLDRAHGRFDLVLMLAVVHHLVVTERIPLSRVVDLAADLTRDGLVVEFVDATDPMFRKLVRGRDHLYSHYNREFFEDALRARFEITRSKAITETRRIYLLRKHK